MTAKTEWPSSLDETELQELDRYLRNHSAQGALLLDGVHGLLSALAVGPLPVLPDEWLPEVLHEPFANEQEGNRVLALLAKLNDSISAELDVDAYRPIVGEVALDTGSTVSAAGWCEGFSRGIDLRAGLWEVRLNQDPHLMELLGPVMALAVDEGILRAEVQFEKLGEDEYDECLAQVPDVLMAVNHYWEAKPVTEDEIRTLTPDADARQEQVQAAGPPRHRAGHWLH